MTDSVHTTTFTGHELVDEHGNTLGKIVDVLFDDDGHAEWGVIDPGPLRPRRWVSLTGSYKTSTDRLVTPVSVEQMKRAPKVKRDHVLGPEDRERLREVFTTSAS